MSDTLFERKCAKRPDEATLLLEYGLSGTKLVLKSVEHGVDHYRKFWLDAEMVYTLIAALERAARRMEVVEESANGVTPT